MSQAVEDTHAIASGDARGHRTHRTRVRPGSGARRLAMSRLRRSTLTPIVLLTAVALIMIAAPVYVFLGEKGIAVSSLLWTVALDFCRGLTGLFGLLAIVSAVPRRRSESRGNGILGSVATGVVLIAAAAAGLGLVIVITGLTGLGLLYAGGVVAVDAFRSSRREPARTR